MVFLNRVTQEMTVKIVYYGPGLCGKTTNLQQIYQKTSPETRGEMVSLETEADRTLFFDLLPLEVGRIGGYKTRLQLYTVPGQVFYNTTRKVVLKGVDGIVFVADSQKEMLDANLESFKNLRENMDELGVDLDDIPIVIQYNKRDLPNVMSIDDLNKYINKKNYPNHPATAIRGDGVFDTLKEISKGTLKHLRRRLTESSQPSPPPPPIQKPKQAEAKAKVAEAKAKVAEAKAKVAEAKAKVAKPAPAIPPAKGKKPAPAKPARRETLDKVEFARSIGKEEQAMEVRHVKVKHSLDILSELEKIKSRSAKKKRVKSRSTSSLEDLLFKTANHKKEIQKSFDLSLTKKQLSKAKNVKIILQLDDGNNKELISFSDIDIALRDTENIAQLFLDLKVKLQSQ